MIFIILYIANDPLSYSIAEGAGTPVPRPLLSVVASDLDGDTITYAINPASVSIILNNIAIDGLKKLWKYLKD